MSTPSNVVQGGFLDYISVAMCRLIPRAFLVSLTPALFVTRSFGAECSVFILTVRFNGVRENERQLAVYSHTKTNLLFEQSKKPLKHR